MTTINPLGDLCNYSKIKILFEKNKDKPWNDWLEFDALFGKPGKQGVVGILKVKGTNMTVAFKISQEIDHLIPHEYSVMNGLNDLAPYCPHFCKSFGMVDCQRNPRTISNTHPFEAHADVKYMIDDKMLLSEHIDKSNKFHSYIKSDKKIHEDVLYSSVKQVLLAIAMAQKRKNFSHYDLHSLNILMRKCNKDVVFVYVLDKENQVCVPTLGHYPVIIDFGFSYISDMEDGPLLPTMGHTSSGFTSDRFDHIVDPKLFLVTVADEIKCARGTKKSKILKRVVKNSFSCLNIDWFSGWDENEDDNLTEEVTKFTTDYCEKSIIFSEYENFCIDLFQTLIILPLEKCDYQNPKRSFRAFLTEWVKIENTISNAYYNLYILKGAIEAARYVRVAYMDESTSKEATKTFSEMLHQTIDKVAKFCKPKPIDYEKMLCSMYVFADSIEGIYYEAMEERMEEKNKLYEKLPLKSVQHIYAAIDVNIPTKYTYTDKTTVFLMNSINDTTAVFCLKPEEIIKLNKSHSLIRGSILYDIHSCSKSP
jgi:hypothetical protein